MDKLNHNERFKVASTLHDLNEKLTINIEKDKPKKIYWYVKFNLGLQKKSITKKSMVVLDMNGNVLETSFFYNEEKNVIIISPMSNYELNKYYILCINKGIVSKSGKKLENTINIMFKLQ